jgi:carbamoyl-phosphate synthase large subunit
MKSFMILGAGILQIPLIEQVKKSGYRTIVVSPDRDEPGACLADCFLCADVRDEKTILKYAEESRISAIMTDQTDLPVRTVAYVAEKMGLPGIGYDTATLFTDKYLMREKCRELGIQTLAYKKVSKLEEALLFFERLNKPVILKPIDNQGSKGVSKAETKSEVSDKFYEAMRYSASRSILIEEFVNGREFVVEGMAYAHQYRNLICGDTYYFDLPDVFSATSRVFPSVADKQLTKRVLELNERVVTGFGLKQGISHSEFIMKDDELYLIETAARGGGVFISSDLISLSTGINTEEFLVNIASGSAFSMPDIHESGRVCCYTAFFLPEGEVISVDGIEMVQAMPFIRRTNLNQIRAGMKTGQIRDKTSRYFMIVHAGTHEQLASFVERIKEAIRITVWTKAGLQGPIWS